MGLLVHFKLQLKTELIYLKLSKKCLKLFLNLEKLKLVKKLETSPLQELILIKMLKNYKTLKLLNKIFKKKMKDVGVEYLEINK